MKTQRIYVYLKEENFCFSSRGSALALQCIDGDEDVDGVVNSYDYVDDENDDASKYSG